jgi:hypothetical protein
MRLSLGQAPTIVSTGLTTSAACGGLPVLTSGCGAGTYWSAKSCGAVLGPDGQSLGICVDSPAQTPTTTSNLTALLVIGGLLLLLFLVKR